MFKISNVVKEEENSSYQIADLYLDEKTREVKRGNNLVDLTPREFDLLLFNEA